jgi:hypothetical protein
LREIVKGDLENDDANQEVTAQKKDRKNQAPLECLYWHIFSTTCPSNGFRYTKKRGLRFYAQTSSIEFRANRGWTASYKPE